jgi:arginine deiminase
MGLARDEFRGGRGAVFGLLGAWDYIVEPLPNLVFARDCSVWIGDSVAVTSPPGRRAEAELAAIIFAYHPLFAGTKRLYEPGDELLAGGDVLLLAPGVVAIGTGAQTSPAGLERLARRVFDCGFAHTVLAVLTGPSGTECLDSPVGQWDDAGNLLALGPQTVISYERNTLTNARLEAAGFEVVQVPGSELAGCRGGPRAICCPVGRDPASMPDERGRAA